MKSKKDPVIYRWNVDAETAKRRLKEGFGKPRMHSKIGHVAVYHSSDGKTFKKACEDPFAVLLVNFCLEQGWHPHVYLDWHGSNDFTFQGLKYRKLIEWAFFEKMLAEAAIRPRLFDVVLFWDFQYIPGTARGKIESLAKLKQLGVRWQNFIEDEIGVVDDVLPRTTVRKLISNPKYATFATKLWYALQRGQIERRSSEHKRIAAELKAKGKKLGRPPLIREQIENMLKSGHSPNIIAERGFSKASIHRAYKGWNQNKKKI